MAGFVSLEHLSAQFKVYLLILHTIVLGWIVHILINVFHNKSESNSKYVANITKDSPSVRVVHVDDKRVTVESCHWLNSILNWVHMNASNSTPDLVKIWLTMLNEKLKIDKVQTSCFLIYACTMEHYLYWNSQIITFYMQASACPNELIFCTNMLVLFTSTQCCWNKITQCITNILHTLVFEFLQADK